MLRTAQDYSPDGPGDAWTEDGHVRWSGGQCAALSGVVGERVRCVIYTRRPQPCRDCAPGSQSCLVARRARGLPVPTVVSDLDALLG